MDGKRSFQVIYERFQPGILRFLSRLVGEEEAEDVAQGAFLRVDRGLKGFRGESSIGTWIYRIARNAALDRLRSRPAWLESTRQLRWLERVRICPAAMDQIGMLRLIQAHRSSRKEEVIRLGGDLPPAFDISHIPVQSTL